MKAEDFRKLALAFPDAVEASHMNHPDFRIRGKIFATLSGADLEWGMVKLTPTQQRSFIEIDADAFQPAKGAWGRQGCTMIRLAAAQKGDVQAALEAAKEGANEEGKRKKAKGKKRK